MKFWTWLRWLFYNLMALYRMSSVISYDHADRLFLCLYNQWCNKQIFEHLQRCWFILAPETKDIVQHCAMSACGLHLPYDFTMQELCNNKLSHSQKKNCFYICVQKFYDYAKKLEEEAYFTNAYEMLWHTKNCLSPYFDVCSNLN